MDNSTAETSIEDGEYIDPYIVQVTDTSTPSSTIENGHPPIDASDAKVVGFKHVNNPDALLFPLPEVVGLLNVTVVMEMGSGLRDDSGTCDPPEI